MRKKYTTQEIVKRKRNNCKAERGSADTIPFAEGLHPIRFTGNRENKRKERRSREAEKKKESLSKYLSIDDMLKGYYSVPSPRDTY